MENLLPWCGKSPKLASMAWNFFRNLLPCRGKTAKPASKAWNFPRPRFPGTGRKLSPAGAVCGIPRPFPATPDRRTARKCAAGNRRRPPMGAQFTVPLVLSPFPSPGRARVPRAAAAGDSRPPNPAAAPCIPDVHRTSPRSACRPPFQKQNGRPIRSPVSSGRPPPSELHLGNYSSVVVELLPDELVIAVSVTQLASNVVVVVGPTSVALSVRLPNTSP